MKYLYLLTFIPFSLVGMQTPEPLSVSEKAKLKNEEIHAQTTHLIEHAIPEDSIVDWPQFFKNIEDVSTKQQQEEYKQKLLQKVNPYLFSLASRFDHRELLESVQFKTTDDGKKIITRDESTVITMPEGVPNRIALNNNGTALAINYANTIQTISKKNHWGNDSYERKQRYPIQSLAFTAPQATAFTREHAVCLFDVKTKEGGTITKPTLGKNILISPDANYLLYDFINSGIATRHIALHDLRTEEINLFGREKNGITGWHFKKFATSSRGDFIAATESKLIFGCNNKNLYTLTIPSKKSLPSSFITDCDINQSGDTAIAIGDHNFHLYAAKDGLKLKTGTTGHRLDAVRFHPCDNTIIFATDVGIIILNRETFKYRIIPVPRLRALALSEDGDTIGAAGDDAIFILSRKELKKLLSIPQLMLIKRLATETPQKVFTATQFMDIFKNIKNHALQQNLVKFFKLDYEQFGYDQCSICNHHFCDKEIRCKHSFCTDCLESWQESGKNTCPLCRAAIVE